MLSPLPLRRSTLEDLAERLPVPAYDAADLAPSVVHLSVGGFHRSHQAVCFDALARRGHRGWGVVGVSHRRRETSRVLRAQDGLYTVVVRGPDRDEPRVVGVHREHLHAGDEPEAVLAALAAPAVRLVTLTVTLAGYEVDPGDARRDRPRTVPGLLAAALDRRRRAGLGPFTVLSCDNLPANGAATRAAVLELAAGRDPALARWIEAEAAFPNSLVDRITPQTTEADRAALAAEFGVLDACPVVTEPYSQWIVEDAFCAGRPPLDEAGVRFVPDVRPFALTKTRLLNGTHCALGYLGGLAGHETTDAAMADPALAGYVERLLAEVRPLLPRVLGMDLRAYERALLARVGNPRLSDQLHRLRRNGSVKVPSHLVPSLAEARLRRRPHAALLLAVAAWVRDTRAEPRVLLAREELFGDLGRDEGFAAELEARVRDLDRLGVHGCLAGAPQRATVTA